VVAWRQEVVGQPCGLVTEAFGFDAEIDHPLGVHGRRLVGKHDLQIHTQILSTRRSASAPAPRQATPRPGETAGITLVRCPRLPPPRPSISRGCWNSSGLATTASC